MSSSSDRPCSMFDLPRDGLSQRSAIIRGVAVWLAVIGVALPCVAAIWRAPAIEASQAESGESSEEGETEQVSASCLRPGRQRLPTPGWVSFHAVRLPRSVRPERRTCPPWRTGLRRPDGGLAPLRL